MRYLTELKVTEEELKKLKETHTLLCGLSEREQEILRESAKAGDVLACTTDGFFVTCLGPLFPGHCYRLRSRVKLPTPPPAKRESTKPFEHEVDGQMMWCCPVYELALSGLPVLRFVEPVMGMDTYVSAVASFPDFLGMMTEDKSGWPEDWLYDACEPNRNVSNLLASYPKRPFAFVCFRKS